MLTAGAVTAWLGRADQLLDVTGVGLSNRLPRAFSITSCNCPLANRRWFPTTLIVLGKPSMSGTIRYLNPYPDWKFQTRIWNIPGTGNQAGINSLSVPFFSSQVSSLSHHTAKTHILNMTSMFLSRWTAIFPISSCKADFRDSLSYCNLYLNNFL